MYIFCAALSCENGMEYNECGQICTGSCFVGKDEETCSDECFEGCFCPKGTVLHEGRCIERTECPCMIGNERVEPNESIKIGCMEW